jgi:hypothetical protein
MAGATREVAKAGIKATRLRKALDGKVSMVKAMRGRKKTGPRPRKELQMRSVRAAFRPIITY